VSKESRRAARAARESRRLGAAGSRPATGDDASSAAPTSGPGAGVPVASGTRRQPPAARAGRRERVRRYHEPTFLEKYRAVLIGIAAVAVLAVVVGVVFISATQPVYACGSEFNPSPTPTVSPGASGVRLGFAEDDMGNSHSVSRPQKYLFCPPASGNHINQAGKGPIQPRVYKPGDDVGPPNWIHNLEHGGLVVLYQSNSPGSSADGLKAFQDFFNTFPTSPICQVPPGQIGPVIAPFDSMTHPYAVLVWDRVLFMDTWDPALAIRFFNEEDERLDKDGALIAPPEDVTGCKARIAPSASPSAAPSASNAPAASASDVPSADASAASSASPEPSPSAS